MLFRRGDEAMSCTNDVFIMRLLSNSDQGLSCKKETFLPRLIRFFADARRNSPGVISEGRQIQPLRAAFPTSHHEADATDHEI
jgi:hypothetical protein